MISPGVSVLQRIEKHARERPHGIAAVCGAQSITYGDLNRRADALAGRLRAEGIGRDTLVGVAVERSIGMVVGLVATWKAGGAYVPLDPAYPQARLAFMLEDAGVTVLVTQRGLAPRFDACGRLPVFVDDEHPEAAANSAACADADLAYVIYTSGSTGQPKGVEVTHGGFRNFLEAMESETDITSGDTFLAVTTLSFDIAAMEMFLPLVAGAHMVIASRETAADGEALARLLTASGATMMFGTPVTWNLLLAAGWNGDKKLKVLCGGETMTRQLADALLSRGAKVWNMFGPTETTICSTMSLVLPQEGPVPIGGPIANTHVFVMDERGMPVSEGGSGELWIGGRGVARGYRNRPELTAEKFVMWRDQRLFRTGDRVRRRPDGELEYLGRLDDQLKIRGFRVETREIEHALEALPEVRAAAVVVREDAPGDRRLVAYIAGRKDAEAGVRLREFLPDYMVPSRFVFLDSLPLTANGKIDRRALPAPHDDQDVPARNSQPRDERDTRLLAIFQDVLRTKSLGIHDDFFHAGGDSLLATQVVSRIREQWPVEITARLLFQSPSVAQLARRIGELLPAVRRQIARGDRDGSAPLSFGQQRFWFLDQFHQSERAIYNLPLAWRLRGEVEVATLEAALNTVVARHETLRTNFPSDAISVIHPAVHISVSVVDVENDVWELATQEGARPFDLARDPLLRATFFRISPDEGVLLLTMHHIISDGWSVGVLLREVDHLYAGGAPEALPELALQYADFAAWQRQWLQGPVLAEHVEFWKQQLAGAPRMLALPTDHPRPAQQTYAGSLHRFHLSPELTGSVKELARAEGATLFMVLLAAWKVLLFRYTGETDLSIGTPIANRTLAETENLVGFFANTLVMRTNLGNAPTFREVLAQVKETALAAYAHQDLPFEKLVEAIDPERQLSSSPLFQVLFTLQNANADCLRLAGITAEPLVELSTTAKFDLSLEFTEQADRLRGVLEFNPDLFERATVLRMAGHLEMLLAGATADPLSRIAELPLMGPEERTALTVLGEGPALEYPLIAFPALLREQAESHPAAVALVYGDEEITYSELQERVDRIARNLRDLIGGPGLLVGLCMSRSIDMIVGLLAIWRAGAAYVPVDPEYPRERQRFILQDSRVALLVTDSYDSLEVPGVSVVPFDDLLFRDPPIAELQPVTLDSAAYVIYTSGSTGTPKGVEITHRSLINLFSSMRDTFNLSCKDTMLALATGAFDMSVPELYLLLTVGGRVVLAPRHALSDGETLRGILERSGATIMQATPTTWRLLMEAGWAGDPRLRILCGAEAMPRALAEMLLPRGASVWNLFGPTETTVWSTVARVESGRGNVPIGRPLANTQLLVVDESSQLVPQGVPGELLIAGDGLAHGYFDRPELTAERFIYLDGRRVFRTGDRVRYRPDGQLEFVTRLDDQVKLRGFRIELGEVEAALLAQPGIRAAAAAVREDAPGDKRLVAYVTGEACSDLREALSRELPEYMVPSRFVFLDALPVSANGKVDRGALPALEDISGCSGMEQAYRAPESQEEQSLAAIFAEVLKLERVGVDDNFFHLGGHSLLATRVITRARALWKTEISLRTIFEAPTVAQLASRIGPL